jgi:hypothetical protein
MRVAKRKTVIHRTALERTIETPLTYIFLSMPSSTFYSMPHYFTIIVDTFNSDIYNIKSDIMFDFVP